MDVIHHGQAVECHLMCVCGGVVSAGDRVAQLILERIAIADVVECPDLDNTYVFAITRVVCV